MIDKKTLSQVINFIYAGAGFRIDTAGMIFTGDKESCLLRAVAGMEYVFLLEPGSMSKKVNPYNGFRNLDYVTSIVYQCIDEQWSLDTRLRMNIEHPSRRLQ